MNKAIIPLSLSLSVNVSVDPTHNTIASPPTDPPANDSSQKLDNEDENGYHFIEASHSQHVLSGLNTMRQTKSFCDITLVADGREFHCHKLVLASFSSYFRAMFAADMAESKQNRISINGVESTMIDLILEYAYTAEVYITKNNVQALLSAANLLEVLPVRDACCEFMDSKMDESNCIGVHCFAETHACLELQKKAKDYTLSHFTEVCQQEEFEKLSQSKLIEFISDDELNVDSEETVFNVAVKWLAYDEQGRQQHFSQVLSHVRLPLVSPYFLHDSVSKHPSIVKSSACHVLVEDAKTYQLLLDRRNELRSPRTRPRKCSGSLEVIIAVGGEDDKVVLRSVESFDPRKNQWKTLACLPFAVSKHGLVVTGNNYLYMAGGEYPDGSASRSMWRYDPCLDTWQEMQPMNVPRSELGLAMLDGYVYAVGGWDGSDRLDTIERYNPQTNTWTFVAPMRMSATSPAVVAFEGQLYVTGGAVLEDGDGIELVQCYNPNNNTWNKLKDMIIPRSGSAACILNGQIFVIGGWHASTENTNKVESYNPSTNEWSLKVAMNERRYRPGVAVVDGKIYVCGGEEGWDRYHDTIECYNPETDSWEFIGEMPTSRSWLSCIAMTINKENVMRERISSCLI